MIWACIATALAIATASSAAEAAERKLLILIDASGSMTAARDNSDGNGATRFEVARTLAKGRITFYENQIDPQGRPLRVAVYTFRGDDEPPVLHTAAGTNSGFADANTARKVINCLTETPDPTVCATTPDGGAPFFVEGNTPLANALCAAVDVFAPFTGDARYLQVSSDGEENSSVSTACAGTLDGVYDPGTNAYVPAGAWQNKVIGVYTGKGILSHTDLFEIRNLPFRRSIESDPEGVLDPEARQFALTASSLTGLTPLEQFFQLFSQVTGGSVSVVFDDQPTPVIGDSDGDGCVGHTDAIPVARAFGPVAPPRDGTFDLNLDGVVNFADYQIQLSLIQPGCGTDPYVARAPIVCSGARRIVIDGQSIESGAITIDVRGACDITIKNSLIVSGTNAITILGTASLTIDNSIIVGQGAVLSQLGAGVVSAANSVFHGAFSTVGAFKIIDRGGNVFE